MAAALRANEGLQELDVSANRLGDLGAKMLTEGLGDSLCFFELRVRTDFFSTLTLFLIFSNFWKIIFVLPRHFLLVDVRTISENHRTNFRL